MNGQEIKTIRNGLKLSQHEFAQKLGVGRRTVIRWESDMTKPDKEVQQKLSHLVGKITGEGDKETENVTGDTLSDAKVTGDTPKNVTGQPQKVTGKSDILDKNVTGDTLSDTKVTGDTPKNVTGQLEKVTGESDTLEENVTGDRIIENGKSNNFLDTALEYFEKQRWAIHPLVPRKKKPISDEWQKWSHELPTREQIENWWTENPDYNIGLVTGETSGVVVLDIDLQKNPNALTELEAIAGSGIHKKIVCPFVRTPGGGIHAYFAYPEGANIGCNSIGIACIDTRGNGGNIVLPPSIHPDGGVYKWHLPFEDRDLPPLPDAIVAKLDKDRPTPKPRPADAKLNPNDLLSVMMEKCAFCREFTPDTGDMHEELWYRWLTQMVCYESGTELAYELSSGSPKFDDKTTQKKIEHAQDALNKGLAPYTCEEIIDCEGWTSEDCENCIAYHRKSSPAGLPYILQGLENEKARAGILSNEGKTVEESALLSAFIDEPPDEPIPDDVLDAAAEKEQAKNQSAKDILGEISILDEPTPEAIQTKLWDFVTDASYWTPAELGRFCDELNIKYSVTKTWLRGWKYAIIRERRKRSAQAQRHTVTDDADKPTINTSKRHMRDITADAISAINRVNTQKPFVFVRSGLPTRITVDENNNAIANPLTIAATRGIMERAANFVAETDIEGETIETPVSPPLDIVNDFLSLGNFPFLPPLVGVSTAPMVAPDGTIYTEGGYQPEIRYFYHREGKIEIGDIIPTPENVEKAKRLILDELYCDFPFADQASHTNTIALMLTPFVRPLIDGATPLHVIDASTPGTGKSLLADIASMPFIPSGPTIMTAGKDDDEWRKRITAKLMGAPSHVLIDNVKQKLSSGDLGAALTAHTWEDRILGQTAMIRFPVKCTWIVTGNNIELSDEIARRSVWIRLEANVERPWERTGFRHANLRGWVRKHRGEVISALLTLVKKWIADGRPQADDVILGSYEGWIAVVGGILKAVNIEGFLANATELYDQLDLERQAWIEFFWMWAETYGAYDPETNSWGAYAEMDSGARVWQEKESGEPVGTKELFPLASHFDDNPNEGQGILDGFLGKGKERARRISLGKQIQKRKGRILGSYRLEILSRKRHQATVYQLTKSEGECRQFQFPSKESSHTVASEVRGECGELKSTPCSTGGETHYTTRVLSSDRSERSGSGGEINSPHSPKAFDDRYNPNRGADLREGECPKSTFPQDSEAEDTESEEREVFEI